MTTAWPPGDNDFLIRLQVALQRAIAPGRKLIAARRHAADNGPAWTGSRRKLQQPQDRLLADAECQERCRQHEEQAR